MTTAIDTNILLDIPNDRSHEASALALKELAARIPGRLRHRYAELCINFERREGCDDFLETNEIRVQP